MGWSGPELVFAAAIVAALLMACAMDGAPRRQATGLLIASEATLAAAVLSGLGFWQ